MDFNEGDAADTSQVEDRRGGGGGGLRGGMLGAGAGGLGIVGVIIAIISSLAGGGGGGVTGAGGLGDILNNITAQAAPAGGGTASTIGTSCSGATSTTDNAQFIACVQTNVQGYWRDLFTQSGQTYDAAKLVLFSGSTQSACGPATSDTGPFYCPGDAKVYLDLDFFAELESRFGAQGGDFAQAYVIAHEYGHHVQDLLGIESQMRQLQQKYPSKANEYSVRLELQADCFAGVWGNAAYAAGKVSQSEITQALDAAAAVGDDRIQKAATGRVNPETFTHGTAAQRQKWFRIGFDTGDTDKCDTFNASI